jgi:hypothetical protein
MQFYFASGAFVKMLFYFLPALSGEPLIDLF